MTLRKLEFDVVRGLLAARCGGTLGRQLVERIAPHAAANMVERWLGQVREMQTAADTIGLPPLGGARDIRSFLERSGTPAGLEADHLADIAATLQTTGLVQRWAAGLAESATRLRRIVERAGDFTPLANRIHEVVDDRGHVRDDASPKLGSIRSTIEKARSQIDVVFRRILRQSSITRYLQYANATFHNDRRVLPLKAEHRGRLPGIIHRSSDTGATLFVEPTEAVELNNTIVRLGLDEHKEVTRILADLSRLVHMNAGEIGKSLEAMAVLDLLGAKVRFARDFDAHVPEIDADGKLLLIQARHPILLSMQHEAVQEGRSREDVVPIDVRLGDDFDLLVITGPNTGGKTVAIKTVGLLVLMAQAGIPIPAAAGSRVPVYRRVFVDIGDEQSIEQSLSTFSAHLAAVLPILEGADRGSLVLVDELGAGTDPDEGAAIGRAVVEALLAKQAHAIVTTHLSALKAVAFTEARVDNASVEFDAVTLRPRYRLVIGEPGNSNALIIAERLGMPHAMIERAKHHLDTRHQALTNAIAGTLQSRRDAERARAQALQEIQETLVRQRELERRTADLNQARLDHQRWMDWVSGLNSGDEVYVRPFERTGRVVRVHLQRQTATVSSGSMDLEVRLTELSPADGKP
ncbi:MAG: DNA strand exchange inhibitor protein [Phycisphaerales bacterium]|nr:DNA strand exchange inhibitor protein [Phycisphaerales bacterium]